MNFWRRPSDSSTRFCVLIQERPLRSDITETAIFPSLRRDDVVDVLEQQHGFCNVEIELLKITVLDFVCDSSVRLRAFDDSHILREYLSELRLDQLVELHECDDLVGLPSSTHVWRRLCMSARIARAVPRKLTSPGHLPPDED